MTKKVAAITLAVLAGASVFAQQTQQSLSKPQTLPYAGASEDVYEAVVQFQIRSWQLASQSYCVEIDGKNASPNFLARFRPLPVKPASECRQQSYSVAMKVIDRKTKKPSVIFNAEKIVWLTANEADVEGGYICASQCMAGGTYHLSRDGAHWIVKSFDARVQA